MRRMGGGFYARVRACMRAANTRQINALQPRLLGSDSGGVTVVMVVVVVVVAAVIAVVLVGRCAGVAVAAACCCFCPRQRCIIRQT